MIQWRIQGAQEARVPYVGQAIRLSLFFLISAHRRLCDLTWPPSQIAPPPRIKEILDPPLILASHEENARVSWIVLEIVTRGHYGGGSHQVAALLHEPRASFGSPRPFPFPPLGRGTKYSSEVCRMLVHLSHPCSRAYSGEDFFLSLSGGFTPCRHLRPSSGREHTIV